FGLEREFHGSFFLNIDSESRLSVSVQITASKGQRTGYQVMNVRRKVVLLLDAEARNREIHMIGRDLVHRIVVAALLPGCSYAEAFAKRGDFLCGSDAAR